MDHCKAIRYSNQYPRLRPEAEAYYGGEDTSGQSEDCPVYSGGLIYISAYVCLYVLKVCALARAHSAAMVRAR